MRELKFAGVVAVLVVAHQLGLPIETAVVLAGTALIYFVARGAGRSREAQSPPRIDDLRRATALSQTHAENLCSARNRRVVEQLAPDTVRYLASHLSQASTIAQGLSHRRARFLARKIAHLARQYHALSRPRARHNARTAARLHVLARQASQVNAMTRRYERGLSRDPAGRHLAAYLTSASALASALDVTFSRPYADDRATARHDRARRRAEAQTRRAERAARQQTGRVTPLARKLMAVAAALLPAASQERYIEEFWSELWELAHSGASRWRQLRQAWGLLRTALSLRRALLAGRMRNPPS